MPGTVDSFLDEVGGNLSAVHRHLTKGVESLAQMVQNSQDEQQRLKKENDALVNAMRRIMGEIERTEGGDPRTVLLDAMDDLGWAYEKPCDGTPYGQWRHRDAPHIVKGIAGA